MTCHGGFIWYELLTPDPDAAAEFYGAVVGWTIPPEADPLVTAASFTLMAAPASAAVGVTVMELTELDTSAV